MEKNNKTEKVANVAEKAVNNMAETIIALMDKLAGKGSDIKLSFEDLSLDMGIFKTRLNGAIVLDIVYAKEVKPTGFSDKPKSY